MVLLYYKYNAEYVAKCYDRGERQEDNEKFAKMIFAKVLLKTNFKTT